MLLDDCFFHLIISFVPVGVSDLVGRLARSTNNSSHILKQNIRDIFNLKLFR